MTTPATRKPRRPYVAPRLRRIRLAADEIMAAGCKMASPSAGFQSALHKPQSFVTRESVRSCRPIQSGGNERWQGKEAHGASFGYHTFASGAFKVGR
jgi:hypothetical protein